MTSGPRNKNITTIALFENIINALKNNNAANIGTLSKYAINQYYSKENKHFDLLQENFIDEYVSNESLLEGVHSPAEKQGLKAIYEYIFSNYSDENFDINYLLKLHEILYSKAPYPEAGGKFRTEPARIGGAVISLCTWEEIPNEINKTNKWVSKIIKESSRVLETNNIDVLFNYIEQCLKLNCHLIRIHPFRDGNGRTVRAFTNKLFILAGIPPVYVHAKEKEIYHKAMEKAITQNDFTSIINFYHIKICQSIYELGINPNSNLKTKTNFKKIKKIALNYKITYEDNKPHINDLSYHYAHAIKMELEDEKIEAKIGTIPVNSDEEYTYLTSPMPTDTKIRTILIDPLFSDYITQNNVFIDPDLPLNLRKGLTELFNDGVTTLDIEELNLYRQIMTSVEKTNQKPKQLIKR